jgi:hypothetical protein
MTVYYESYELDGLTARLNKHNDEIVIECDGAGLTMRVSNGEGRVRRLRPVNRSGVRRL